MRELRGQTQHSAAHDMVGEELLSLCFLGGMLPGDGGQLQEAGHGPIGEQAQKVAKITPGLDVVHAAAGQERYEDGIDLSALVTATKKPVFAAHHLPAQMQLAPIVMEGQAPVFEKTLQGLSLVQRVPDASCDRRQIQDEVALPFTEGKEGVQQRPGLLRASFFARFEASAAFSVWPCFS